MDRKKINADDKVIILTCVPVNINKMIWTNLPEYPNKHFEQVNCDKCNELMYMGPGQKRVYSERKCLAFCMLCTVKFTGVSSVQDLHCVKDLI